ncbi:response regulator [Luteibacter aegosomaticola]|uniref:response regulator n=1 Tax=Luteibacter aegosomaticola TaxID=2911538 RepID=UPI001FF70861|nr:response regulator [Luteibacter aegosomaticola]UPG88215.1 response regulator [Luteibacter aegosomaticola]
MTKQPSHSPRRTRADAGTVVILVVVVLFFVASGLLAGANIRTIRADNAQVIRSQETVAALADILSSVQDAETGQRGFLLTGNDAYLDPYRTALAVIPTRVDTIRLALDGDAGQQARLRELAARVNDKLDELKETIELRRDKGLDAALAVVSSDRGKVAMDDIRARLAAMRAIEFDQRTRRLAEMETAYSTALTSGAASALLGVGLTLFVAVLIRRNARAQAREAWLQMGRLELAAAMSGDKDIEEVAAAILGFLARFTNAQAGVLFARADDALRCVGAVGLAPAAGVASRTAGGTLVARAADEREVMVVSDVPAGYVTVGSGLGQGEPRHLVIAPGVVDGEVHGVVELGFFKAVDADVVALLEQASPAIAVALRSAAYRAELGRLLQETQRQSEALQVQQEELRVSNEELEEQSQALRESQHELEEQQAELEQTNAHLADHSQQLSAQRDALAAANRSIEAKAEEVERASRYKSEFLANMSHELRTPLNSALILSKLLADNAPGNLTDEQVKFARTIHASGNDLLTLINDILDLSKIEAGHVETHPEPVSVDALLKGLAARLSPLAAEKGLSFAVTIESGCPPVIETDRQRLEQVLKNLLSNALKFTESGGVTVSARLERGGMVAFAVTDTGIGIAPDQQGRIFDAFQQADGSISRRYGGTGLGLSISQELARLLGGAIEVTSEPGMGSTFTLTVTSAMNGITVGQESRAPTVPEPVHRSTDTSMSVPALAPASMGLSPAVLPLRDSEAGRLILVIEDDAAFAEIVGSQARQMGFRTIHASTAGEALVMAREQLPQAIVLDIGLPDQSGLHVLDILKHDVRTRHIPIHVVSGSDHSRTALSLGAVGYLVKPVSQDDLGSVLDSLEARLSQRPRRVLVVEDDAVQLDAIRHLLATADVETVGAATAAECLAALKAQTFDCMVLDLSLPDTSGLALLEAMSASDEHAFPPVIVYTGRVLSSAEEERLRRYSNSIIIKGAKSPERLLDEVTLFLHQVVSELPEPQQGMVRAALHRDSVLEGRRIMLVEDDVRNVFALMNVLEPHGCIVTVARNGQEAIDLLAQSGSGGQEPTELVLMDIMMPVKDGLTATREIRQDARFTKLPIIALTAKAMPDDRAQALEAGASDYVAKPLDVDKLLSLIRVWLTDRR